MNRHNFSLTRNIFQSMKRLTRFKIRHYKAKKPLYRFKTRHYKAKKPLYRFKIRYYKAKKPLYRFRIRHYKAMKRHNYLTRNKLQSIKRLYRLKIRQFEAMKRLCRFKDRRCNRKIGVVSRYRRIGQSEIRPTLSATLAMKLLQQKQLT
jgi:hypothetical protein